MKNNQKGITRTKALIYIAALCVAGLIVFAKMQVNTMLSQIASLGATVAQQSAQVSEIVGKYNRNYALFLHKTGNLPAGLSFDDGAIQAANKAKIKAIVDTNNIVILEVSNLDTKSCVKIATKNWGHPQTTRFVGVGIGKAPDFSCLNDNSCKFNYIAAFPGTSDYPFTDERATFPCSLFENNKQPASVYLGYKL